MVYSTILERESTLGLPFPDKPNEKGIVVKIKKNVGLFFYRANKNLLRHQ